MNRIATAVASVIVMHGSFASAAIVTFNFSGTVDGFNSSIFNGIAGIGDLFTVTFDLETTTADSSADVGVGRYSNAVTALSFQVGSYAASAAFPVTFLVTNDFGDGRDSVEVVSREINGPNIDSFVPDEFRLQLVDRTGTAFASDALPTAQIDPADFDDPLGFSFLSLVFKNPAGGPIAAISAEFNPIIPVPTTGVLLACGFLGITARRRRAAQVPRGCESTRTVLQSLVTRTRDRNRRA